MPYPCPHEAPAVSPHSAGSSGPPRVDRARLDPPGSEEGNRTPISRRPRRTDHSRPQPQALPKESGYLGIIGVSAQTLTGQTPTPGGHPLAIQSQNYYMLTRDKPINYLHWLASDDTHILIEGGPVDYYIFRPDGRVEQQTLGLDFAHGQRPVVAVPGNCWKALRLRDGAAYALMANALSPEWTPDRVKIGAGEDWIRRYTGKAPWATPEALRTFIGPNWTP